MLTRASLSDPAALVHLPTIDPNDFGDCAFTSGEHTTLNPRISGAPELSKALSELLKSRDKEADLVSNSKPEHAEHAELTTFLGFPRTRGASERDRAVTGCFRSKSPEFLHPSFRVNSPASEEEVSFAELVEAHQLHLTRGINKNEERSAKNLQNSSTVICGDNASATTKHIQNTNQRKVTPVRHITSALSPRLTPTKPPQEINPPNLTRRRLQRKAPGGLRERLSTVFQRSRPEPGL